jgi:hypothetical protein
MKKCTAALLGGVAALLTLPAAQAAPAAAIAPGTLAAGSYAELLQPVPDAVAQLRATDAAAARAPARLQLAQYHHHHHHHHHHGFGPGFALGVIGGALGAAPYYAPPPPPAYYDEPDDAVAYCERRYRSYDPRTGTYLGYDGYRHPCP